MFEIGNTYPTIEGKGKYTILKIVEDTAYPVHAYDYAEGDFMTFTLEGRVHSDRTSEGDLVQPMRIGQKLIDNEGDEWYVLPDNVVASPKLGDFGRIEGNCINYVNAYYTYEKA